MRLLFLMFVTAVCVLFLLKLRWPETKSIYGLFHNVCLMLSPVSDGNHHSMASTPRTNSMKKRRAIRDLGKLI